MSGPPVFFKFSVPPISSPAQALTCNVLAFCRTYIEALIGDMRSADIGNLEKKSLAYSVRAAPLQRGFGGDLALEKSDSLNRSSLGCVARSF